jgi:putative mRNA 3-end processing factor
VDLSHSGLLLRETPKGLFLEMGTKKIALDPTRKVSADYIFISHAHSDHLPKSVGDATVIASEETVSLARQRGLRIERHQDSAPGIQLVDTGHILGSRGLLADGVFYYTGDLGGRSRGFMKAPRRVRCGTLLIESTYGRPQYRFPPLATVLRTANELISSAIEAGRPAFIEGYPLGKSQVLTYLFQSWSPLHVFGTVKTYNDIYRDFGVDLPSPSRHIKTADELRREKGKGSLIIAPSTSVKGEVRSAVSDINAMVLRFTGWALLRSAGFHDTSMLPISDHADYFELIKFVEQCRPDEVITTHGYASDFAISLKRLGYSARALGQRQFRITDYLR